MDIRREWFFVGVTTVIAVIVGMVSVAVVQDRFDIKSRAEISKSSFMLENEYKQLLEEVAMLRKAVNEREVSLLTSPSGRDELRAIPVTLKNDVDELKRSVKEVKQLLEAQVKLKTFATSLDVESAKIDALVKGSAAVSSPTFAKKGEPFKAMLRIRRGDLVSLLSSLKKDAPKDASQVGKADVKLTPRMTATLVGQGFDITPKDGIPQAVSGKEETTWEWLVMPTGSGKLTLRFALAGTLLVEGTEISRQFYTYTQNVDVSVGLLGFVETYWQWLATTIVIPVCVFILHFLRKRNAPVCCQATSDCRKAAFPTKSKAG